MDGSHVSFDPGTGLIDMPGGMAKFSIRRHAETSAYTTLVNESNASRLFTGFQYVDWQYYGDDIIYLARTAYRGAHTYNDSNRITFHRLEHFRQYL